MENKEKVQVHFRRITVNRIFSTNYRAGENISHVVGPTMVKPLWLLLRGEPIEQRKFGYRGLQQLNYIYCMDDGVQDHRFKLRMDFKNEPGDDSLASLVSYGIAEIFDRNAKERNAFTEEELKKQLELLRDMIHFVDIERICNAVNENCIMVNGRNECISNFFLELVLKKFIEAMNYGVSGKKIVIVTHADLLKNSLRDVDRIKTDLQNMFKYPQQVLMDEPALCQNKCCYIPDLLRKQKKLAQKKFVRRRPQGNMKNGPRRPNGQKFHGTGNMATGSGNGVPRPGNGTPGHGNWAAGAKRRNAGTGRNPGYRKPGQPRPNGARTHHSPVPNQKIPTTQRQPGSNTMINKNEVIL